MSSCLIVDDSSVVRKVARRILEDLGFACNEAEDGEKAYAHCEQNMPEAILLDWNMPVMDGLEFLHKLRGMENGAYPKVVFCTTENTAANIKKAMDGGANEFIMKPFDGEIIATKFKQVGLLDI